ncbi:MULTISPECIES: SseB family protein [Amycolatopsis]|uniref:SseB family protein n=1 Tax=Amycolatopsis TaxID=1813 RepID=UPI001F420600|nr:SseB family protein [Amycolatopsis tucumanensis]MCF6423841.1 SseB family protein [Amycolatopsis tucumanensis]
MEPVWQPDNEIEHALQAALADGDGRRYAQLLLAAPVYLPVLPARGTPEWEELVGLLPLEREHVLVFTSPRSMAAVLGPFAQEHVQTTFAEIRGSWQPGSSLQLAINPGLPIGAVLAPDALIALAEGREQLVAAADAEEAAFEEMRRRVRELVLEEFGAGREPGPVPAPSNALETALVAAVGGQDENAYLEALVNGQVVVATTRPVQDSDEDLPWRTAGSGDFPVVALFSSTAMLDRLAPGQPYATVPFLGVLAQWPDESHVLCFNPGAETELILTGEGVFDLVEVVAGALSPGGGGD